VEQGQEATISPTDDVPTLEAPVREAPELWRRRVSTGSLPFHAPNEALEATGHSAGFFSQFVGRWSCGPRLSLGVRPFGRKEKTKTSHVGEKNL
jgi:hypothetical protein